MPRLYLPAALALLAAVVPASAQLPESTRTVPRIVLVGDSTVTDDSGWGLGFKQMLESVTVINTAANGRSSKSFIDEGRWRAALALGGDYYLIQFGHNDEPGKGPERETTPDTTYRANLERYVDDVRAQGGIPILVTSLVRRLFEPGMNRIRTTQTAYVEAVRSVATARAVPLIDLFVSSSVVASRLGSEALARYSLRNADGSVDTTHLNAEGSLLFGRLVATDVVRAAPALSTLLREQPSPARDIRVDHPPDAIVAASGPGTHKTVQDAINAASPNTTAERRWQIFVTAGRYRERIYVQREKRFVSLVGADPLTTTVSFNVKGSDIGPDALAVGTYRTPTMVVDADDFAVENLTIENSSGPGSQALALRVDGDRFVMRNSRLIGWQDTLFINRGRHYFEDTVITGHVDFIFGGATAWFERCRLHAWDDGYITAASTPSEATYGYVFANGRITGETPAVRTYLGRPWRSFARVVWLRTEMSEVVRPEGWHNWNQPDREKTTHYAEFDSRGAGASSDGRVPWARRLTAADADEYWPARVFDGWNPRSVPSFPSRTRATAAHPLTAPGRQ